MKFINALSRRAPAPLKRQNRAPAILAALSKSRIPNISPRVTWSLTGKPNCGIFPQTLNSRLSSSDNPAGTVSWGMLGIFSMNSESSTSTRASSASRLFIRPDSSRISAVISRTSRPSFFILATSSETLFLVALLPSTSERISLLFRSSSAKGARSMSICLADTASLTISMFSLTNRISSTGKTPKSIVSNRIRPCCYPAALPCTGPCQKR